MKSDEVQAYEEGAMDARAQREFEDKLAQSESLRAELEGFRHFKASTRAANDFDGVPTERLELILRQVAQSAKRPSIRARNILAPVAAAAAIGGWVFWLRTDRVNLAITPEADMSTVETVAEADAYFLQEANLDLPRFELVSGAKTTFARIGEADQWVCVDIEYKNNNYYMYVSKTPSLLDHASSNRSVNGRTYYESHGIGWKSGTLGFYLKGGEANARRQIAEYVASQMEL